MLVDRDSATTGSRNERLVEVEADHHEICDVGEGSTLIEEMKDYFKLVDSWVEGLHNRPLQQGSCLIFRYLQC